jgi:hypothetical protein
VLPSDPRRDEELDELRGQLTAALAKVAALEGQKARLEESTPPSAPSSSRQRRGARAQRPQELELTALRALIDRTRTVLSPEECAQLKGALDALAYITRELETTTVTLARLRRFLFGTSEKTNQVLGSERSTSDAGTSPPAPSPETAGQSEPGAVPGPDAKDAKPKAPGHGRHSAAAYTGATKIPVPHPQHHHGDRCPGCQKGRVYDLKAPQALVRIVGVAPLSATVYECEQLRCNLCLQIFSAPPPEGVGSKKYDESVTSMIALCKYGVGLPFNRIEKMQHAMGIPMPATTQWELVEQGAKDLLPVHAELVRQGAAGEVLHTDDTSMKVIELSPEQRAQLLGAGTEDRTGVFTTGIVATRSEGERIALYYTGPRHSGENLARLFEKRAEELPPPIQMSDAGAANTAGAFETIVANCLAHGRRHFVDVAPHFPKECRFVLETLREVYRNDALAKAQQLSPEARLRLHQEQSAPLMTKLRAWLDKQLDDHLVEPNSSLGEALRYMTKHWDKLTLFQRKAGAPLDNNICERALKKAILHRKNSLFYKTLQGAAVGDLFMSLIHTCELNGVGTFEYLVAVLRHHDAAAKKPAAWMPWNYIEALQQQ